MEMHVLPTIVECVMTIATFDLWMSKTKFDTFDLAIDFIDDDWVFHHVTIGMFETLDTSRTTLISFDYISIHKQGDCLC